MTDRSRLRRAYRLIGAAAVTVGLMAAGTGVASAHITVAAPEATSGGSDVVISFRVPDESEAARTVGLKVRLPGDTTIASVLVQPKPGWTASVSNTKLSTPIKTDDGEITEAVSEIEWKVSAGTPGIGPGQFDEFVFIAGQLPQAKSLTFKAIQTYSDGSSVSWIEEPAPGSSAEPEHPAPVLTLGAGSPSEAASSEPASSESASSGGPSSAAVSASASAAPSRAVTATSDAASKSSAVTGIVLGALGVLLGLAALALALRNRRGPRSLG
jgi:uncharacterized protein